MDTERKEEINKETTPKKKLSLFRKVLRIFTYIILGIIGLNILIYLLLCIPFVQEKVVNFAVDQLKPILKTEVKIDKVQLTLFNHVQLQGVYVEDQAKDTLLYAKDVDVRLSPLRLLKNELRFDAIELDDFLINVSQQHPDSAFNFQFIIDAFASDKETPPSENPMAIVFEKIQIEGGRLNYNVFSEPLTPDTFNASHISVRDFSADLRLNSIDVEKLDVNVNSLKLKEQSGLVITDAKFDLQSKGDSIYWGDFTLSLPNSKLDLSKGSFNTKTNRFSITSNNSTLSPIDVTPFMSDLRFLKHNIKINAAVTGKLPEVTIGNLIINYGEDNAVINADGYIADYNKYYDSDLRLRINQLRLTSDAVSDFAKLGDSTFVLPDIVKDMGDIRLTGDLSGRFENLKLNTDLWINQGALALNATASADSSFSKYDFSGTLHTQNFNLGSLLKNNDLGRLSASVKIGVKQTSPTNLQAQLAGEISEIQYDKQSIKHILLSAYYDPNKMGGTINANLPIGGLDVTAEMIPSKIAEYSIDLNLTNLHVDRFYENPEWENPLLSLKLTGNLKGNDINTMTGVVSLDDFKFTREGYSFAPGQILLQSSVEGQNRMISINSSLLDFSLNGKYDFVSLATEIENLLSEHLPSVFDKPRGRKRYANNFTIDGQIKNSENMSQFFNLPFTVVSPISIAGKVNTPDEQLDLLIKAPHLSVNDMDIEDSQLSLGNGERFDINAQSKLMTDSGFIAMNLVAKIETDSVKTMLDIKSDDLAINVIDAHVQAMASFEKDKQRVLTSIVSVVPTDVQFGKLKIALLPAEIKNRGTRTEITNFGIAIEDKPYFGVNGVISENEKDSIDVYFSNAEIGKLFKAFDVNHISAVLDGNIILTNILSGTPELYSRRFEMRDIVLFQDTIGSLNMKSHWSPEEKAIRLLAKLTRPGSESTLMGLAYPAQDSLAMRIDIQKFPLGWAQHFVPDILSQLDGDISSDLRVKGKISAPQVTGWLGTNNLTLGVDYTNVVYTISDTIKITPDKAGFENLRIKDQFGNEAWADATVSHKNFTDIEYSISMYLENLMVLNTANRTDSLFYGRVFATGGVEIEGNNDDINIKMDVRNNKKSFINILLPQTSDAAEYKSIVYINTPKNEADSVEKVVEAPLPLKLGVELTVTPDIALGVILDPTTGDAMQINGSGFIRFSYDMMTDDMKAFGDYILSGGSVKLKLQKLSTMEFKIEEGSKLSFSGDPMKTSFDIKAYKRVRADIATLDESFKTSGLSTGRIPVDCVLGIKGNIDQMSLTYNISLPDAPDDVKQKVNSLINTDEQKIKNFAYLIATGSFYPAGSGGGDIFSGFAANAVSGIASSVLSTGLDAVFGNILGDKWQIGADVSSGDGNFSDMDVTVNVSRKFFDDKLSVNTNLGYRTDQSAINDNSFIGDFDLEYELTQSLKLKAYSHTNDKLYKQAATTQGIGVVYTKEAKALKDLFGFFRRKNKEKTKK